MRFLKSTILVVLIFLCISNKSSAISYNEDIDILDHSSILSNKNELSTLVESYPNLEKQIILNDWIQSIELGLRNDNQISYGLIGLGLTYKKKFKFEVQGAYGNHKITPDEFIEKKNVVFPVVYYFFPNFYLNPHVSFALGYHQHVNHKQKQDDRSLCKEFGLGLDFNLHKLLKITAGKTRKKLWLSNRGNLYDTNKSDKITSYIQLTMSLSLI